MTEPMRPLTIFLSFPTVPLTDWRPSGDGLLAHKIITELANRGHIIHVATVRADLRSSFPQSVTVHQMNPDARRCPSALSYMLWSRRTMQMVRAETRLDLVHELNPVFSLLSLAFVGSGIPVVLGPHSSRWPADADGEPSRRKKLRRAVTDIVKKFCVGQQHRRARAILLSTPAALNNVSHPERMTGRLYLLPPGIDDKEFSPSFTNEGAQARRVLFLANVLQRKGIFTLLQAFEQVAARQPEARLVIAGDGKALAAAKLIAAAMHCRSRIEFLGRVGRDQAPDLLRRCSVYCLPSHGEPFGISALEAMACERPLVTTDAGGLAYLVSERGGRCVPVGDASALADALLELLCDAQLRRRMGKYNRSQIEASYAWPKVISRLERIYREVVTGEPLAIDDRITSTDILEYRNRVSRSGTSKPASFAAEVA